MTNDTAITEQARAVFLAALMVLSVMVGTVALSGGAAASVTTATVADGDATVSGDNPIAISGSADDSGTVYAFIDDGSTEGEFDEDDTETTISELAEDGSFEDQIANPGESGEYDIHVVQKGETGLEEGDTGEVVKTIEVDADKPVFGDEHERQVTTTTPTLTVPLSDANTSVNASTIEVDLSNGDEVIHKVNAPSSEDDGISYDGSEELTIDLSADGLEALENGDTYTVNVYAEDTVGNFNDTSFDVVVDTGEPTFTLDSPTEDVVGEPTQSIGVLINGNDINDSTAKLTVSGPDGELFTNTSDDGVYNEDDSFTVDPSSEDIPELPNGTIEVSVSAADDHGNENSTTFSFEVDNEKPIVESVDTNQSEYYGDDTEMEVTVDFNEPVDESTVTADINVDGTSYPLEAGDFEQGTDENESTVFATYDLSTISAENGSATVVVDGGEDTVENTADLTAGSNSTTFAIDTIKPTVTVSSDLPDPLPQRVDLTDHVTATQADDNEPVIGWQVDEDDTPEAFENPASVDTRELPEGEINIVAGVEDENGTFVVSDPVTRAVDNAEPSVEYTSDKPLAGNEDGIEYDVKDLVEVSDNGTEVVSEYGYKTAEDEQFTFGEDPSFTVDEDAEYTFAVKVNNPDSGIQTFETDPVNAVVFDSDELDITVEQNSEDAGDLNVIVTSDVELGSLNLTVQSNDDHYKQSSKTFSSPDEITQNEEDGTWNYTVVYDAPRDGFYVASIDNATMMNGLSVSEAGFAGAAANGSEPSIVDADVVGLDGDGNSIVSVKFSEPVQNVEASDFTFAGDRASVESVTSTDMAGEVRLTFDSEIQTGDDEAVLSVDEGAYTDAGGNENSKESDYIDSVELDLQKGMNYVSVPLETGKVSLDELKKEGELNHVKVIWTYDGGEWTSYDPSADENDLTALEGGDGYIVKTKSDTEVDVRGYTRLADSTGDGPVTPEVEGIEAGWNLVGHFHEETTDASSSFGFTYDSDAGVIGQGSGYALERVSTLESGESYWVFARSSGHYTATEDTSEPGTVSIENVDVTEMDGDDTVTNGDMVTISADASADAGVFAVVADASNLGGANDVVLSEDGDGSYSATVLVNEPPAETDGSVSVTAIDNAGQDDSDSDSVQIDTTAASISSFSVDHIESQTVEVSFDSDEQLSTIAVTGTDDASSTTLSEGDFTESGDSASGYTYTATLSEGADGTFGATLDSAVDAAGNDGAGDESDSVTVDTTFDGVSSKSPTGSSVATDSSLSLTFNEDVQAGSGSITVFDSSDSEIASISVTSGMVSGDTVTVDSSSVTLADATSYYVQVDDGAIEDTSGNAYSGIQDTTSWTFTTADNEPAYATDSPSISDATADGFTVNAESAGNEDVTAHYVVVTDDDSSPPNADQIKAGTDADDSAAAAAGSFDLNSGNSYTNSATVDSITDSETYDVYVVIEDDDGNTIVSDRVDASTSDAAT